MTSFLRKLKINAINMNKLGLLDDCILQSQPADVEMRGGIFTYIYHKNHPNVGKYSLHGSYGIWMLRKNIFLGFHMADPPPK